MVLDSNTQSNRRSFIKRAGVGVSALAVAGCQGDGGDGGGDGGSTETTDGGDETDGTATSTEELEQVNMIFGPGGFTGIIYDQMINKTNRLENRMNDAGYTVKAQESWEGAALFAAGGPDFSDIAGLEAATLANERELELVTFGKTIANFVGWITRTGSAYDPDESGSVQASVENIASDGKVAIGSWGGGDIPAEKVMMKDQYDLSFDEDSGDFEVVTADYFALPGLVVDGEVATVSTAPQYGAAQYFVGDDPALKGIFWNADMLDEMGYGPRPINGWTTTQQFRDENTGAVKALIGAWEETVADFLSQPYEYATQEPYMEAITAQNEKQAEFLVEFCIENKHSFNSPLMYETVSLSEEDIQQETDYINRAAELGQVPSGWDEYLELASVDST